MADRTVSGYGKETINQIRAQFGINLLRINDPSEIDKYIQQIKKELQGSDGEMYSNGLKRYKEFLNKFKKNDYHGEIIKITETYKNTENLNNKINNQTTINEINEQLLYEGNQIFRISKHYKRNGKLRKECIDFNKINNKVSCKICGFNFSEVYGLEFENCIEIHHINVLSEQQAKKQKAPTCYKKDLIPLCSNCHTVIHSKRNSTYTYQDVIEMIEKNKK